VSRSRALEDVCRHHAPVVVNAVEGGHRAHCLRCGAIGPVRERREAAWRAILPRETQADTHSDDVRIGRYR
jgi:hypothetical protein